MNETTAPRRRIIPVSEVLNVVPVSRSKLYQLFDEGELDRVNIGSRAFVTGESLDRFLDSLRDERRPSRRNLKSQAVTAGDLSGGDKRTPRRHG